VICFKICLSNLIVIILFDSNETFQFFQDTDNIVAPVPEPATFALFGLGLAGLIGSRFRRKK